MSGDRELEAQIKKLKDSLGDYKKLHGEAVSKLDNIHGSNSKLKKNLKAATKTITTLATISIVEALIISGPLLESVGSFLGIGASEAAVVEATALRNAAKLVRDAAKTTNEISEFIGKRAPRAKIEEQCGKFASRMASKILSKVKEELEDKAAEVIAMGLVNGFSRLECRRSETMTSE